MSAGARSATWPPLLLLLSLLAVPTVRGAEPSTRLALEEPFPQLRFEQPVALVQAPGDPNRWFLAEKAGRVRFFENELRSPVAGVFVDISDRVDAKPTEAGLLGIAFHPEFSKNGQVFLSYTAPGKGKAKLISRISRFTSKDGGRSLDPSSEVVALSLEQPYVNHNGGGIAFGPDGYLYAGYGDGGSGGDPHGNGQNTDTLLGKMLRIDVDHGNPYAIPADNPFATGGGRPEIFAWGLRNPWRWSFDRETKELWAGDVGQWRWEEIDRIRKGGNYGWNVREGAHCFKYKQCRNVGLIDPVVEYSRADGLSVIGGYVYRGSALPELRGTYVYGDWGSGKIWGISSAETHPRPRLLLDSGLAVSSFGEDVSGELYLLDYREGRVYRLVKAGQRTK